MLKKWANILVRDGMKPYKVIITDGEWKTDIPVENTRLESVKRAIWQLFNIPSSRVLITEILDDADERDTTNPKI